MTATPDKPIVTLGYIDIPTYLVDPIVRDAAYTFAFSRVLLASIVKPSRYLHTAMREVDKELGYSVDSQLDLMSVFENKWENTDPANTQLREEHLLAFNKARANAAFFVHLIGLTVNDEVIRNVRNDTRLRRVSKALAREVTHRMSGGHLDIIHAVNAVAVIKFSNIN